MKYEIGQLVILLDTTYKPAAEAEIKAIDADAHKYNVEYQFPKGSTPQQLWVPQERLVLAQAV